MKIILTNLIIILYCYTNICAQCIPCINFLESLPCEFNVNEPSWNNVHENTKRAVFKYGYRSTDGNELNICTGTLLNQMVNQNQIQDYFYTSWHCLNGEDLSRTYTFVFNYQSPDADNCSVPTTNRGCVYQQAPSGAFGFGYEYIHESTITVVDHWYIGDQVLCRIDNPIPPHFNVYYAGWLPNIGLITNSLEFNAAYANFIGIHHPEGDIKKISRMTYMEPQINPVATSVTIITTIINWIACHIFNNCDYNIQYIINYTEVPSYLADVYNGTLEEGSSGSPLFNRDGRVMGSLVGSVTGEIFGDNCNDVLNDVQYTKFKNFYNYDAVRNVLNPSGAGSVNNNGIGGRKRTCYDNLNLQGNYFPLSHYQSDNHFDLHANNDINVVGPLNIFGESDYTFTAGGDINLGNNLNVDLTAEFAAIPGNTSAYCDPNSYRETQHYNSLDEIKLIVANLPKKKKFDICDYKEPINIYPNPTKENITISIFVKSNYTIEIFNVLGERIYNEEGKVNDHQLEQKFVVDMALVPSGFYLAKITTTDGQAWSKLFSKN